MIATRELKNTNVIEPTNNSLSPMKHNMVDYIFVTYARL